MKFAFTLKVFSGSTGSLLVTVILKRCGPSMPSCIVKTTLNPLLSPGCNVVGPTTGLGGQQPSTAFTAILSITSCWLPTLVNSKVWSTMSPFHTSP